MNVGLGVSFDPLVIGSRTTRLRLSARHPHRTDP
jgi:hypothetical protein